MGDYDFRSGRRLTPPSLFPVSGPRTGPLFTDALTRAKDKPQGDPEKDPNGEIDHRILQGQTLGRIGPLYHQDVADLTLTNKIDDPDLIYAGDSLRVLSTERRTSLRTILSLQKDLDAAKTPEEKTAKEKALRTAVNADLMQAAEHQGFDPAGLKTALDDRGADLTELGPEDKDFARIVGEERQAVEGNINGLFQPLAGKIAAARKDPAQWPEVQAELVRQFESLAKGGPEREAAINRARDTLRLFGPDDAKFQQAVDDAGREILVVRPAKAVVDAYHSGEVPFSGGSDALRAEAKQEDGARRAAKTLREVTAGATPETAVLILQEAKVDGARPGETVPVANRIETTIGRRTAILAGALPDHELGGRNSGISGEVKLTLSLGLKDMVGDLSAVVEHVSGAPQAAAVAEDTAKGISGAITATEQQTFKDWEAKLPPEAKGLSLDDKKKLAQEMGNPYPEIKEANGQQAHASDAYRLAVADGKGATLSAAVVAQLKQSGNTTRANDLFGGLVKAPDELKQNTQNAVGDFARDHLVVASDWQNSLSPEQLATALNKSLERNPGSKQAMDQRGAQVVRALSVLHEAAPELKGLEGYDQFTTALTGLETDEKASYAVMNSEAAWNEFGRLYLQSTSPEPKQEEVPASPTLYWSTRSVVGMTRTLAAYDGMAGRTLYQPPSTANIDAAARLSPQVTDPRLAHLASGYLASPNAATNPAMRQQSIEDLGRAFENSRLDPRNGITTTTGFGKGLAGLQGSMYLLSANDLVHSDSVVYQAFAAWLYGGMAMEGAQLGAGGLQNLVQSGRIPAGGFLDKASSFARVKGQPGWEWFPKYMDRVGGALMVAYTLDYAAKGRWANAAFAGVTTIGTFLALMKSPKAGVWGAALSVVGIVGEYIYDGIRKEQKAAYYEGPTRQFLIDAGYDAKAADILADHDDEGHSIGPALVPLAKELGTTPQKLLADLADPKNAGKLREFVTQSQWVKPNDQGEYPMTAPPRRPPVTVPGGEQVYPDGPPSRPRTIPELATWSRENLKL